MKKLLILATTLTLAAPSFAAEKLSITVEEISSEAFALQNIGLEGGSNAGGNGKIMSGETTGGSAGGETTKPTLSDRVDTAGKVISTAKDIVALGEAIYDLVKKGKPSNTTEFTPISVVPKDPSTKEIIDPFELEGFSMPVEKNFSTKVRSAVGKELVAFTYKVIYSYGGSYNGAGKYLTNVMIVPGSVKTTHGWEFNATMKLSGIMNHGTKADPVAGALVTVKYQMNGMNTAFERNDTIHVTGRGELKNLSNP